MSDLLTVSEVASLLRVEGSTVRRWVKRGTLDAVTLPHVNKENPHYIYRIKRETVNKLLDQFSVQGGEKGETNTAGHETNCSNKG